MASYLDKQRVNTAITDSTKLDLSHQHITTASWMQLSPIMFKEMVPGEKLDVNVETFSRMDPLPVPTFGRANIKNRAFFVPYRTIFKGWNDFITDADHVGSGGAKSYGLIGQVPTVDNDELCVALAGTTAINQFSVPGTAPDPNTPGDLGDYDFIYSGTIGGTAGNYYRKFTNLGRQAYKVLCSLGYQVNWNELDNTTYSALPLLAFAKVYLDWFFPSVYVNHTGYRDIDVILNYDYNNVPIQLVVGDVQNILLLACFVAYDSDYFVSAFDQPNSPTSGNYSTDFKLLNIDTASEVFPTTARTTGVLSGYVTNNSGQASADIRVGATNAPFISPYVTGGASGQTGVVTPISEYLLHGLHALTDYMKRHQLAGSRAMDRYLARFGKALPAEKLNRSKYLGCQLVPISIGDVMSNSDTAGASLGTYAGKGLAYGQNGNFTCSTDEYGMFIVVSSIVPATGYFQGIDRTVKHISKLDFWTPEFDNLGVQAIGADELYISQDGSSNFANIGIHSQVFGFTPRYAEYKVGRDQLTGNFRCRSLNAAGEFGSGSSSYHLMREFDDSDWSGSISNMVHNFNFMTSTGDDYGQFNRIFYNTNYYAPDQFTLIHNFNVASWSPMKPLYDTYEFEDKGHKVDLDVNGVKMN